MWKQSFDMPFMPEKHWLWWVSSANCIGSTLYAAVVRHTPYNIQRKMLQIKYLNDKYHAVNS